MKHEVETANLILITYDKRLLDIAMAARKRLHDYLRLTLPDDYSENGSALLMHPPPGGRGEERQADWTIYFPVTKANNRIIGTCGLRPNTASDGVVEMSYGVNDEARTFGYASEIVGGLLMIAFLNPSVTAVEAYAPYHDSADASVLLSNGFSRVAPATNGNKQRLAAWRITRNAYNTVVRKQAYQLYPLQRGA